MNDTLVMRTSDAVGFLTDGHVLRRDWVIFTKQLAEEGIREPIVINRVRGNLHSLGDGNSRLIAAVFLGWPCVPVRIRER